MIINYSVDENDYLTHQLYVASKSMTIKNSRLMGKIITPIILVGFGCVKFNEGNLFMLILLSTLAIIWFFFYPLIEKHRYKKYYKNFIKETYKNTSGKAATLEVNDEYILSNHDGNESKILIKELEEINEIDNYIFIKLKIGGSFVLPKNKINSVNDLVFKLQELSKTLGIKYNFEKNWKWE